MCQQKYDPLWPLQAAAYFHAGVSFGEIPAKFALTRRQFLAECRRHPELERAAREGRLDDPVEEALLRRAIGFSHSEVVSEDIVDKKTGEILESCRRRVVTKEVPPDIRALLFWLKNRRPERWRERHVPEEDNFEFVPDQTDREL